MSKSRIDQMLMKIKIGKEAASFALKAQRKELNYDDQSQNRRKEAEVCQNVPEGSRSKLEAIRESFRRQDEQRKEFMKIWQQANPVMPKVSSDIPAEYKDKFDYMATKPREVLTALRRQDEERRLEIEQFEIECRKKREKWDAEWQKMFDSCLGQASVSERPRVTSATASRSEARVNEIVVSSAAVVQAYLDGVGEAASMSARAIHCQEHKNCGAPEKKAVGNVSMGEKTVWSEPGQNGVATSSEYSAAVMGVGLLDECSADWSSSEGSGNDVSARTGITTVDCKLKESLLEKYGDVSHQVEEINQNDVVCVEVVTCDDADGVPEECQDVVEMEEECRDASREWCRCKGIYELNEELMSEQCGGILEDECEGVSLEEGAMEEWIFPSDDEDEADDVRGGALDGLQATYSDFRNASPAGVIGSSVLAEKNDGDSHCRGKYGIRPWRELNVDLRDWCRLQSPKTR